MEFKASQPKNYTKHLILLLMIIKSSLQTCSFTQYCKDVNDISSCDLPKASTYEPFPYNTTDKMCPEFANETVCCNEGQNLFMRENFKTMDFIFSSAYDGCDICAINLKRLWCHFTCSKNQSNFVTPGDYLNITDGSVIKTVLQLNMTINLKTNCELFDSCKKTKYATLVPSMQNAIGFTTFQGIESYRKGPLVIYTNYDDKNGVKFEVDPCNITDTERWGYPMKKNCTCNTCQNFCVYNNDISRINVFEGFDFLLVGILFAIVIFITLLLYFIKRRMSSNKSSLQGSIISINETNGENNYVSYHRLSDERRSNNKVQINNVKNFNQ